MPVPVPKTRSSSRLHLARAGALGDTAAGRCRPVQEDASNTAAEQALQVGFNHDGTHYFPLPKFGNSRGLLVVNHEYTDASQIYSSAQGSAITSDAAGREKVAKALAGHGVSVIAIQKGADGKWDVVPGEPRNRRITGTTPMQFSGPVRADHPMLRSTITPSPLGTLNNCAHGCDALGHLPGVRGELERLLRHGRHVVDGDAPRGTLRRDSLRVRLQLAQGRAALRRGPQSQ